MGVRKNYIIELLSFAVALCATVKVDGQQRDSLELLRKVIVTDQRKVAGFKTAVPVQTVDKWRMSLLHTISVADAARQFAGASIKDYGGIGGLKTISVRSLGASNTAVLYDGISISEVQSGQIDLGTLSSSFLQSVSLFQGAPPTLLLPARIFSAPSVLDIRTDSYRPVDLTSTRWQLTAKAGSFGLVQGGGAAAIPLSKRSLLTADAVRLYSSGNYPYKIENGPYSEVRRRENSMASSVRAEVNLFNQFRDSSFLQTKLWYYDSKRNLPGAVIFFNPHSRQILWNGDVSAQSRFQKKLGKIVSLLLSAKYSSARTRYRDPDFLNSAGGIDDRYLQQEGYISAASSFNVAPQLHLAVAADIAKTILSSSKENLGHPSRWAMWNHAGIKYKSSKVEVNTSVVNSFYREADHGGSADRNKITPTASFSFRPGKESPLLFRAFFKQAYRMPSFNDLYYNFIGNRNLKPENSRQWNAGITWSQTGTGNMSRLNVSIDGYHNQISDKIVAVPGQNLFNWSMVNFGRVRINGIDLHAEAGFHFSSEVSLFTALSYTGQKALNLTAPGSANYRNRIPYTPDHSGSMNSSLLFRKWTLSYNLLFSGPRYALGSNHPANRLPGWATHDLSLQRELLLPFARATISGALNNLTDTRYDVVRYFPMPGRNFIISLSFKNK